MRESKKLERFGLPLPHSPPGFRRISPKFQQSGLFRMKFQRKFRESLPKLRQKFLGICFVLESDKEIIRKSHGDYLTLRLRSSPSLDPKVKHVVEIDVRQERRCTSSLRRAFLHPRPFPVVQDTCFQPLSDEPYHAPIRYPMPDKLQQPSVVKGVKEISDVRIEHPAHFPRGQSYMKRIQGLVLATLRSETIGETKKICFIDCVQYLGRRTLDNFILQRRHSERPLPPPGFWYERPTYRFCSVRSAFQSLGKTLEFHLQCPAVLLPRLAIDPRGRIPFEAVIRLPQSIDLVNVVHERSELHLPVPSCSLPYPIQSAVRAFPALCPARV